MPYFRLETNVPRERICGLPELLASLTKLVAEHLGKSTKYVSVAVVPAVIGPAPDGGYWLIGLRRSVPPPRGFLHGVRWSTRFARADTMRTLGNCRVALVDMLADVDSAQDL